LLDVAGALALGAVIAPGACWLLGRAWLRGERALFERRTLLGLRGKPFDLRLLSRSVGGGSWFRGAPAFLSVLGGSLSLVGPRPIDQVGGAPDDSAGSMAAVKPGLTGPWRLTGRDASDADQLI